MQQGWGGGPMPQGAWMSGAQRGGQNGGWGGGYPNYGYVQPSVRYA